MVEGALQAIETRPARRMEGKLSVPGDKSISHRAALFASIASGSSTIENFLFCDDCLSTLRAFEAMGVPIDARAEKGTVIVKGVGLRGLKEPHKVLDLGNSGTSMRLLTGLLSGQNFYSVLTGDDSLTNRPMARLIEPLRLMGARIFGRDHDRLPPLTILGSDELKPISYALPLPSAQVKSSILLAGLTASGATSVTEPVKSRDHTERLLQLFGVRVLVEGLRVSVQGPAQLEGCHLSVPGDLSSAAFFLVAAALLPSSHIVIEGVGINPTRSGIIHILKAMGVHINLFNQRVVSAEPVADIEVREEGQRLKAFEIGPEQMPSLIDEVPILAVAATQAQGNSVIHGARELRVKETDRLSAIARNLKALGATVEEKEDGLIIHGGQRLRGGIVNSHGDHRMAMAFLVAGLLAQEPLLVQDIACISTSFPGFWERLQQLIEQ